MALYREGKAALAADGTVTGTGTKWQSSLSLIRPGATIMFLSSPIQMAVVNKVVSDTEIKAITTNGAVVASSDYAILLSDSLSVDGLAQDVAETLRYYQSQETVIADAVEFFKNFDFDSLQDLANQINADSESAQSSSAAAAASENAAKTSENNAKSSEVAAENARDQVQQIINDAGDASTLVVLANPDGFRHIGRCKDIATLRTIEPVESRQVIEVLSYYNGLAQGGGTFWYDPNDSVTEDNGGSCIVTNGGKRWKRIINGAVDVLSFGAKPDDISFDSAPHIQAALDNHDAVSLYGRSYYIGSPIYMPSSTVFDGMGGKLTSIAPSTAGFMAGSIFAPGNYHPDFWEEVPKVAATTTLGSANITLADPNIVNVGDIIRLSSTTGVLSAGFFVSEYLQMARVLSKTGNVITIDGPVESQLTLVAANANQPGYLARFNKPLFCCVDSIIQNIEIDTWDYWTADSATYNVKFSNIWGSAKAVAYGNTFCRSLFEDIRIVFSGRVSELAFGSHDTNLVRITAIASPNGLSASVVFGWAESGRRCTIDTFSIMLNANANPSTVIRVSGHRDSLIKNGSIYVHNNTNNILSVENYGTTADGVRPDCDNVTFENLSIFVTGSSAVVCDVYKSANDSVIKNVAFKNIKYFGPTPSVALYRARGTASNFVNGIQANISSDTGGSIALINSSNNDLTFIGPVSVPSLVSAAAKNNLVIRNSARSSAKGNDFTQEAPLNVTDTTTNAVIKELTYPAGSLRINDKIRLSLSGSTSGTAGKKTVQVGFVGSDSAFKYVELAALAADQVYWTMEVEISFLKTTNSQTQEIETSAIITSFLSKGVASGASVTGSRALSVVPDISLSNFVVQVRAWKENSGDGLSLSRMNLQLEDLTA